MIDENAPIKWQGWYTSLVALRENGWTVNSKPAYANWRDPNCCTSNAYLYLRQERLRLIGRLSGVGDHNCYMLDFLTHERNRLIKPVAVVEAIAAEATADDIPALLDLIVRLQGRPAKPKARHRAAVIGMPRTLLAAHPFLQAAV